MQRKKIVSVSWTRRLPREKRTRNEKRPSKRQLRRRRQLRKRLQHKVKSDLSAYTKRRRKIVGVIRMTTGEGLAEGV